MNEPARMPIPVPRRTDLSVDTFVSDYVSKNRPVVVVGAMRTWQALTAWRPTALKQRFGNERVQVYDDLFRLIDVTTLSEYLERYFDKGPIEDQARGHRVTPYVRWYCHLISDDRVPWADEVFKTINRDWERPFFFPAESFALPFCSTLDSVDPSQDWFPARGLFISGRGGRTRLHVDPWGSDALLCQIYGKKQFTMYEPSQGENLRNADKIVDIEAPDYAAFPQFSNARASVQDALEPGEILFIPSGWYHHFASVTDSVSLTWNFVHLSRLETFLSYLCSRPSAMELKQLAYAYFESPGRRPIKGPTFIDALSSWYRSGKQY